MNRLEFSDINKFFTSLGIVLIIIAALLPWYINQNLSVVIIEQEKINQSTIIGKEIIFNQQNIMLFLSQNTLIIVMSLLLLGGISISFGLWRWVERQKVKDAIEDESLKEKQLNNIENNEKKQIIAEELGTTIEMKPKIVQKYVEIENSVYLKLANYTRVNYDISNNIRIGRYNYDVIIKSKYIEKRSDFIIEVKYYEEIPLYNKPRIDIDNFLLAVINYEKTQERGVIPIIMFVFDDNMNLNEFDVIKEKLIYYSNDVRPNLRIKVIKESEVESQEAIELITR